MMRTTNKQKKEKPMNKTKTIVATIVAAMLAGIFITACGKGAETAPTAANNTIPADSVISSYEPRKEESNAESASSSLTTEQQAIVDEVVSRLDSEDYEALFADMVYPANSVVKEDDIKNFFLLSLTKDELENGIRREKLNGSERIEDGFIKFDYGNEYSGYTTVCLLEDADTPDGYEVRLSGLSGDLFHGGYTDTAQETTLILPSGLTNVVVDGVPLDEYVDETYYEGVDASTLKFDPADYTAYNVVFPCMTFDDMTKEMAEGFKNEFGKELGRYTFTVTADSPYGKLEGIVKESGKHYKDDGYGDHEAELYQPTESTTANDMLLALLGKIYDKANAGQYDVEAYREFFVDGTEDAVIEELTGVLNKLFDKGPRTTVSNLAVHEVHTYTSEQLHQYDAPRIEYTGSGKMDMNIGVHSSYDETVLNSTSHRDAYQQLSLTVSAEDGSVKIVGFAENSHIGNLFNYLSKPFES